LHRYQAKKNSYPKTIKSKTHKISVFKVFAFLNSMAMWRDYPLQESIKFIYKKVPLDLSRDNFL